MCFDKHPKSENHCPSRSFKYFLVLKLHQILDVQLLLEYHFSREHVGCFFFLFHPVHLASSNLERKKNGREICLGKHPLFFLEFFYAVSKCPNMRSLIFIFLSFCLCCQRLKEEIGRVQAVMKSR